LKKNAGVRLNQHGQVFDEIKAANKPLKHTETNDKSKPVVEKIEVRQNPRPTLMADIKEAGGTEGLIKAGSSTQKAKQFEAQIADHAKAAKGPEKKNCLGSQSWPK